MTHFAVPALVLVEATNEQDAYDKVSEALQGVFQLPRLLLDESLDAFAYDPTTTEVHSALDHPGNVGKESPK